MGIVILHRPKRDGNDRLRIACDLLFHLNPTQTLRGKRLIFFCMSPHRNVEMAVQLPFHLIFAAILPHRLPSCRAVQL